MAREGHLTAAPILPEPVDHRFGSLRIHTASQDLSGELQLVTTLLCQRPQQRPLPGAGTKIRASTEQGGQLCQIVIFPKDQTEPIRRHRRPDYDLRPQGRKEFHLMPKVFDAFAPGVKLVGPP